MEKSCGYFSRFALQKFCVLWDLLLTHLIVFPFSLSPPNDEGILSHNMVNCDLYNFNIFSVSNEKIIHTQRQLYKRVYLPGVLHRPRWTTDRWVQLRSVNVSHMTITRGCLTELLISCGSHKTDLTSCGVVRKRNEQLMLTSLAGNWIWIIGTTVVAPTMC